MRLDRKGRESRRTPEGAIGAGEGRRERAPREKQREAGRTGSANDPPAGPAGPARIPARAAKSLRGRCRMRDRRLFLAARGGSSAGPDFGRAAPMTDAIVADGRTERNAAPIGLGGRFYAVMVSIVICILLSFLKYLASKSESLKNPDAFVINQNRF